MKRRNFLKYLGIGAPAVAVAGLSACAATDTLSDNLKRANKQLFEFAEDSKWYQISEPIEWTDVEYVSDFGSFTVRTNNV